MIAYEFLAVPRQLHPDVGGVFDVVHRMAESSKFSADAKAASAYS
jgi:hypothetical protein